MEILSNEGLEFLKSVQHPRIIVMDIDGTLVPHGGTVSARTRHALQSARALGIDILLVTARPPRWLPPVIEALGFPLVAICGNGAITVDTSKSSVLSMLAIPKNAALTLIKELQRIVPDAVFAAETSEFLRAGPGYQDLPPGVRQAEGLIPADRYSTIMRVNSLDELLEQDVYKIVAETFVLEADDFLQKARAAVGHLASVTRSVAGRSFIEFAPLGISKATVLADYTRRLNIDASQVIAFGDMPNDMEMIQWAGIGVAMGNAHADVIRVADFIAPHAAEDGIAIILEKIFSI